MNGWSRAVRDARGLRVRSAGQLSVVLLVAATAACGPYADVGQKLDVTTPFQDAETWVSAQGTDARVLVLGSPQGGSAGFALTSFQTPISAGTSISALQGDWSEDRGAAAATFTARREYRLADERSKSMLTRVGATRDDVDRTARLGFSRSGSQLVITGDAAFSGTYRRLPEALARLGTSTERDAACSFQVVNLAIRAIHVRIIGFGGAGMTQYQNAAAYNATLSGGIRVEMQGYLHNRTTITFGQLVELNGIQVDGPEITEADSSGNGHMSGTLRFVLQPVGGDGAAQPVISGALDYGDGDPADAVQIRSGNPVGGHYVMSLDGGGMARVEPGTAPAPSVAECLALQ